MIQVLVNKPLVVPQIQVGLRAVVGDIDLSVLERAHCAGQGISSYSPHVEGTDLTPLFETIVNYIDPPRGDADGPLQLLVSSIDYNEFVGRIAIGRIERGVVRQNQEIAVCDFHNPRGWS